MIDVTATDEEGMKMTKYPHLRLASGGGNPPENKGVNWLKGLDRGTAFTCKKGGEKSILEVFIIAFKYDKSIVLVDAFNPAMRMAVDPDEWCKKYTYWETIGKEEAVEQPKEITDDKGTVRSSSVEDDVDAP